jgi:hypothetical protein
MGIVCDPPTEHVFMTEQRPAKAEAAQTRPAESGPPVEQAPPTRPVPTGHYERTEAATRLVRRIKKSNPALYCKIPSATSANDPNLEVVITVLLSENALLTSAAGRRDNFRLVCESVEALVSDKWYTFALPAQLEELFTLLCKSLDDDLQVRRLAIRALRSYIFIGDISDELRIVQILNTSGITNEEPVTAQTAIIALKDVDRNVASESVPALISALSHADDKVRRLACEALDDLCEDSLDAIPALVEVAWSDTSDDVGLAAVRALMRMITVDKLVQVLLDASGDLEKLLSRLRIGGEPLRELRQKLQQRQRGLAGNEPCQQQTAEPVSTAEQPGGQFAVSVGAKEGSGLIAGSDAVQAGGNKRHYSSELIGNDISDPTEAMNRERLARRIWSLDEASPKAIDAAKKRVLEWMKNGRLPANRISQGLYVVSRSVLEGLEDSERKK